MFDFDGLNLWAILVAWLVTVAIGAFWYSPAGFGKQWTKLSGVDHMKMPEKEATRTIISIAAFAVIQVVVLALVINSLRINEFGQAVLAAVILWLGFIAATTVGNSLYLSFGWKFWWLNASYFLVVMVINSVLLAIW